MWRVLVVHCNGYYAWLRKQASVREREDERLRLCIKISHEFLTPHTASAYQ